MREEPETEEARMRAIEFGQRIRAMREVQDKLAVEGLLYDYVRELRKQYEPAVQMSWRNDKYQEYMDIQAEIAWAIRTTASQRAQAACKVIQEAKVA